MGWLGGSGGGIPNGGPEKQEGSEKQLADSCLQSANKSSTRVPSARSPVSARVIIFFPDRKQNCTVCLGLLLCDETHQLFPLLV